MRHSVASAGVAGLLGLAAFVSINFADAPLARASIITVAPGAATGTTAGCSLSDAIKAANASSNANVTAGACTPTGSPASGTASNVILLAAGHYVFTQPDNDWYGPNALPPIATNIAIVGDAGGSVIERSAASDTPAFRLFYIGGGQSLADYNAGNLSGCDPDPAAATCKLLGPGMLTLTNLTVKNGLAHGGDSMQGGGGLGAGGAIYNQGTLKLNGVTLSGNEARGGSSNDIVSGYRSGGGIGAPGGGTLDPNVEGFGGGFTTAPWPDPSGPRGIDGDDGTFGNGGVQGWNNLDGNQCGSYHPSNDGGDGGVGGGGGAAGTFSSYFCTGGDGGFGGGGGGGTTQRRAGFGSGDGGDGGFGGGGGGGGDIFGVGEGGFGGGAGNDGGQTIGFGGGGAGLGGAVFNEGGTVTALNTTLSANTAQGGVGSDADGGDGYGGALFNLNGTVTLRYDTLAKNAADGGRGTHRGTAGTGAGGAVYTLYLADPGSPAADAGSAATTTINSSILAGSTNGEGTVVSDCENNAGSFTSGHDLVTRAGSCTFNNNDQTADPEFATNAATANGGPTPTLALESTSPAIDMGDPVGAPASDQRGYPREASPDAGAFQYIAPPTINGLPASLTVDQGSSVPAQSFTLTGMAPLAVTFASSNATLLPAGAISADNDCGNDANHYACTLSLSPSPGETGSTMVTVTATDLQGVSDQASLKLTVRASVQAPVLAPLPMTLAFGAQRIGGPGVSQTLALANTGDTDLTYSMTLSGTASGDYAEHDDCPASETLTAGSRCTVTVTFQPSAAGTRAAALTVTSNAPTSPDTVNLTGKGVVITPTAYDLTLVTYENQSVGGTLPASGPAGDVLSYAVKTDAAHGNVTITDAATGAFKYTPASGYHGTDSFQFTAKDTVTNTVSNPATVSITVNATPPPDQVPPVASNLDLTTYENQTITGTLPASVTPDTDGLHFTATQPQHGTVTVSDAATGAFQYTPDSGYHGNDSFTFTAKDTVTGLTSNTATVSPTVNATPPPNPVAPVASDLDLTAYENQAVTGTLPAVVTPAADTLSFAIKATAQHGSVTVSDPATGAFTYTPDSGYHGSDSFTFTATDTVTGLTSNTATVALTLNATPPPNAVPPVANGVALTTYENEPISGTLPAVVTPAADTLNFALAATPQHGTVQITNQHTGAFTYTPASGYHGTDSFTFQATDTVTGLVSNTATVSLTVNATPPPGQAAPVASNLALTTYENQAVTGTLPAVVTPSADTLSFAIKATAQHGSLSVDNPATGAFTYTPNSGYHGTDSFTFTATDTVTGLASNTATVSLTVNATPPPDQVPPVANSLALTTYENEPITGTLPAVVTPAADTLSFAIKATAQHGTVQIADKHTGAFTYTPASDYHGSDSFTFTASDTVTGLVSNTATVSLTVNATPPPDAVAPVASDLDLTTYENQAITGVLPAVVTPDSDALEFALTSPPAHGSLTLDDAATGAFTYTPDAGYSGADGFQFEATDTDTGLVSNTAAVSLTVKATPPPNPVAPVANDLALTTYENEPISGQLPAVVTPPADTLSFAVGATPAHGTVDITNTATGAFTYTPDRDYHGSDSFTFKATDTVTGLTSDTATVSLTVNKTSPPDAVAPVASDFALTTFENVTYSGTLPAVVTPAADTLVFAVTAQSIHGTVTVTDKHTGAFTYTPAKDYHGGDSFTFTATDTITGLVSNTATVAATVNKTPPPAAVPPVAGDLTLTTYEGSKLSGTLPASVSPAGDTLKFKVKTKPGHGTLKLTDAAAGAFTYTPAKGYVGQDHFAFTATDTDTGLTSNVAVATVRVKKAPVVNFGGGGGAWGAGGLALLAALAGLAALTRRRRGVREKKRT
jgi:hypothetical protein